MASDGAPPPSLQLPDCCCCCSKFLDTTGLEPRHRVLVFLFQLGMVWWLNLETALGLKSQWWANTLVIVVVIPCVLWLKSGLPSCSLTLKSCLPEGCPVRVEKILLLLEENDPLHGS